MSDYEKQLKRLDGLLENLDDEVTALAEAARVAARRPPALNGLQGAIAGARVRLRQAEPASFGVKVATPAETQLREAAATVARLERIYNATEQKGPRWGEAGLDRDRRLAELKLDLAAARERLTAAEALA